jgi:hypothetical protein
MLLAAAKYARPYLECKVRELHQLVFAFAGAHQVRSVLKDGPDEHSWDYNTMSIEPNASKIVDRILLEKIDAEIVFFHLCSLRLSQKS